MEKTKEPLLYAVIGGRLIYTKTRTSGKGRTLVPVDDCMHRSQAAWFPTPEEAVQTKMANIQTRIDRLEKELNDLRALRDRVLDNAARSPEETDYLRPVSEKDLKV